MGKNFRWTWLSMGFLGGCLSWLGYSFFTPQYWFVLIGTFIIYGIGYNMDKFLGNN